jgi:hypothetical protein
LKPGSRRRNWTTSRHRGRVRPAIIFRYRCARGPSQSQDLPRVRLAPATICGMVGSPLRKTPAINLTRDFFCMLDRGGALQPGSPCMSTPALARSKAQATNCQFFTLPWGNPTEARPSHKDSYKLSLENSAAAYDSRCPLGSASLPPRRRTCLEPILLSNH